MENNLMKYDINQLKDMYNKTNDDFKKFFIKKVIEYKIHVLKNNKIITNNKIINDTNKDTLDDLINYSNNDEISEKSDESSKSESSELNNKVEEKYMKEIKFDSANNKLLERLNIESNFRSTDKKNMKKQFVSPFAEDNLYNQQFTSDKYIESIKKIN